MNMYAFLASIWGLIKKVAQVIGDAIKVPIMAIKNPLRYETIREAINGYVFDNGGLEQLVYKRLIEMRDYFFRSDIATSDFQTSKEINKAIKLMDIFMENNGLYFHFEDDNPDKPYDMEHFFDHHRYVCDVYVNTRNIRRFLPNASEDLIKFFTEHRDELYKLKARHLFLEWLKEHEETWSN